ncbi:MAG: molybdopterin-dependent oxidoreductase [Candidatus Planktophila sp.]|jgi:nicotinate dehydrogenase subunit B
MTTPESLIKSPKVSDWLDFSIQGVVGIKTGKVEFGQGIRTALTQIVSEELRVDLGACQILITETEVSPDESFTAGSLSIQDSGLALRLASATAYRVAKDSDYWQVQLTSGWNIDVEIEVWTKNSSDYTIVGHDINNLELASKLAGQATFIQDQRFDGLLFARVLRPPVRGAELISMPSESSSPSVIKIIRNGSFAAVIACDEYSAIDAVEKLSEAAKWSIPANAFNTDDVNTFLNKSARDSQIVHEAGAFNDNAIQMRATYSRPFISHASIGTVTAIAQWDDSKLKIWSQSQGIYPLRSDIARALKIDEAEISISHIEGAGCYGHNGADDVAFDAVLVAREVPGRPVLVTWSRDDELSWAPFGPAMQAELGAQLDDTGAIIQWSHLVRGNGHSTRPFTLPTPSLLAYSHIADGQAIPAAGDPPMPRGGGTGRNSIPLYDFKNAKVVTERLLEMPIRTSAMRALGAHLNVFAIESFLDELAFTSGQDPVEFRLRHLSDSRGRDVIEKVAQISRWGQKLKDGAGQGIGFARYKNKGAWCAVVAQVEAEESLKVTHLWIAVDVGLVINPNGVKNQIEGGALQSMSWTTKEEVHIKEGKVVTNNWEDYPIVKFSDVPIITTEIISRPKMPTLGAGEASIGPTGAAIANALHAAIGVRVKQMPLTYKNIVAGME